MFHKQMPKKPNLPTINSNQLRKPRDDPNNQRKHPNICHHPFSVAMQDEDSARNKNPRMNSSRNEDSNANKNTTQSVSPTHLPF